jgi:predicted PhzF superfamily epimerase YddE/YHI9
VRNGLVRPEEQVEIWQGVEMKRPSRIVASASWDGKRVHNIDIAGRTILVAEGRYFLPLR